MRSDSGSQARVHPLVGDRGFWNSEGLAEVAPIVEIMSSESDHGGGFGRRAVLAGALQSESDQLAKTVLLACHSPTAIEQAQQKHRTCPFCAKKPVRFQEGTPTLRSESARQKDSTRRTPKGLPVRSFQDLLKDMATLTRNSIHFESSASVFNQLTESRFAHKQT